jgi:hypothetical protein
MAAVAAAAAAAAAGDIRCGICTQKQQNVRSERLLAQHTGLAARRDESTHAPCAVGIWHLCSCQQRAAASTGLSATVEEQWTVPVDPVAAAAGGHPAAATVFHPLVALRDLQQSVLLRVMLRHGWGCCCLLAGSAVCGGQAPAAVLLREPVT